MYAVGRKNSVVGRKRGHDLYVVAPGDDTITEKAGGGEALGHEELFYDSAYSFFRRNFFFVLVVKFKFLLLI